MSSGLAEASRDAYQRRSQAGRRDHHRDPPILRQFWYAEEYHQQYLHKNQPAQRPGRHGRDLPHRPRLIASAAVTGASAAAIGG